MNPATIYRLLSEEFTGFALCLYFWAVSPQIATLSPWNLFEEVIWLLPL